MSRIVLAMSGGVDSSVAAWLLKREGHEVVGVFMRHGQQFEDRCATEGVVSAKQGCCSAADAADARRVAEMLDIPFYALNFEREFSRIIDYFVAEYTAGRTPNPCIVCNTWLKFGKLFEYADSVGAEFVATGHYARLRTRCADGRRSPSAAAGTRRRTSRTCCSGSIAICSRGSSSRSAGIAKPKSAGWRRVGPPRGAKPDSQEICFIPDQNHARFVREKRVADRIAADTVGEFVTTAGEVVGHHTGFEAFTVGQRKGLGLAFGEPRYVVRIEPATRRVVLGTLDELTRTELTACRTNWLLPGETLARVGASFPCRVKIRYRSQAYAAEVTPLPESRFHVHFAEPVRGLAPGQAAVCYRDDRVLGGGWIE